MEIGNPLSPYVGMGISLSAFGSKIGCEWSNNSILNLAIILLLNINKSYYQIITIKFSKNGHSILQLVNQLNIF